MERLVRGKAALEWTADTPFLATADAPLVLIRKRTIDRTTRKWWMFVGVIFIFGKKFLKPNSSTSLHVDAVLPDLF